MDELAEGLAASADHTAGRQYYLVLTVTFTFTSHSNLYLYLSQ